MRALGASLRALGDVLGLGEPLFSKTSVSHRQEHDFENLYYQGTGSELQWERMLSRGMKKKLRGEKGVLRATETRSKISSSIKASPGSFLYESLGNDSKRACELESTRARIHESMRVREDECSRARRYESMTS